MPRLSTCALLAFLAFASVAVEGHPDNARSLVIGLLGPYSPDSPLYSTAIAIRQGAELVLSAYMDSTRVQVDFITADSDCSAALSQKAAEHLIENGANVILGDICSGATLNASIITNMAQIVLISPASTSPTLTEKGGNYFFRTAPSDAFQGTYMYKHINGTKVLTLNSEEPYGSGIAKTLAAQFTSDTKTLVGQLTFPESGFTGSVDLSGKPDTVAILTNDIVSAVKIIKDLKDQGFSGQIFGSDSLLSVDIVTQSAGAAEGMIVTTPTLGIPEFQFMYESVYGTAFKPYAAQAADAVMAVSKAFMKGGYKVKNIARKLREVNFNGAIGKVAFDQNGDLKQPVVYQLFQVVGGEFVAK